MSAPLDLDAIEERATVATPGPWGVGNGDTVATNVDQVTGRSFRYGQIIARLDDLDYLEAAAEDEDDVEGQIEADAEFIAHARTDVPALVAEVRRLRALNAGGAA